MSELLIHRTPSVGAVIKKMLAVNPNLSASQIIDFIKKASSTQGYGEFQHAEVIDQDKAVDLARQAHLAPPV